MPPVRSQAATLSKYCALSECYKIVNGTVLYCKACESNVSHYQNLMLLNIYSISCYSKTQLHLRNAELTRTKVQTSIQYPSDNRSHRCAAALVKASLPLNKLEKSEFRKFIEGKVGYKLPSESSLRKTYLFGNSEEPRFTVFERKFGITFICAHYFVRNRATV